MTKDPDMGISFRKETYESFLEEMIVRVQERRTIQMPFESTKALGLMNTANIGPASGDGEFGVGLLQAWAGVLEVLSFYGEMLAGEGYLATAREPRSIRELLAVLAPALKAEGVAPWLGLPTQARSDLPQLLVKPGLSPRTKPSGPPHRQSHPSPQAPTQPTLADILAAKLAAAAIAGAYLDLDPLGLEPALDPLGMLLSEGGALVRAVAVMDEIPLPAAEIKAGHAALPQLELALLILIEAAQGGPAEAALMELAKTLREVTLPQLPRLELEPVVALLYKAHQLSLSLVEKTDGEDKKTLKKLPMLLTQEGIAFLGALLKPELESTAKSLPQIYRILVVLATVAKTLGQAEEALSLVAELERLHQTILQHEQIPDLPEISVDVDVTKIFEKISLETAFGSVELETFYASISVVFLQEGPDHLAALLAEALAATILPLETAAKTGALSALEKQDQSLQKLLHQGPRAVDALNALHNNPKNKHAQKQLRHSLPSLKKTARIITRNINNPEATAPAKKLQKVLHKIEQHHPAGKKQDPAKHPSHPTPPKPKPESDAEKLAKALKDASKLAHQLAKKNKLSPASKKAGLPKVLDQDGPKLLGSLLNPKKKGATDLKPLQKAASALAGNTAGTPNEDTAEKLKKILNKVAEKTAENASHKGSKPPSQGAGSGQGSGPSAQNPPGHDPSHAGHGGHPSGSSGKHPNHPSPHPHKHGPSNQSDGGSGGSGPGGSGGSGSGGSSSSGSGGSSGSDPGGSGGSSPSGSGGSSPGGSGGSSPGGSGGAGGLGPGSPSGSGGSSPSGGSGGTGGSHGPGGPGGFGAPQNPNDPNTPSNPYDPTNPFQPSTTRVVAQSVKPPQGESGLFGYLPAPNDPLLPQPSNTATNPDTPSVGPSPADKETLTAAVAAGASLDTAKYPPSLGLGSVAWLAFTVQAGDSAQADQITIPSGSAMRGRPAGGKPPQTFETIQSVKANLAWNKLAPYLPQTLLKSVIYTTTASLKLDGTKTGLSKGDYVLIIEHDGNNTAVDFHLRKLTNVQSSHKFGYTSIGWDSTAKGPPRVINAPSLFAFQDNAKLFGRKAAQWSKLTPEIQAKFLTPHGGVYKSEHGSWQSFSNGLPTVPVNDLISLPGGNLFAAVAGKGIYYWESDTACWKLITNGTRFRKVTRLFTDSKDYLYATAPDGSLYISKDVGKKWFSIKGSSAVASDGSQITPVLGSLPEAPLNSLVHYQSTYYKTIQQNLPVGWSQNTVDTLKGMFTTVESVDIKKHKRLNGTEVDVITLAGQLPEDVYLVGTGNGVYRANGRGEGWLPLNFGFPNVNPNTHKAGITVSGLAYDSATQFYYAATASGAYRYVQSADSSSGGSSGLLSHILSGASGVLGELAKHLESGDSSGNGPKVDSDVPIPKPQTPRMAWQKSDSGLPAGVVGLSIYYNPSLHNIGGAVEGIFGSLEKQLGSELKDDKGELLKAGIEAALTGGGLGVLTKLGGSLLKKSLQGLTQYGLSSKGMSPPGTLYMGTNRGLFVSYDRGVNWQPSSRGLVGSDGDTGSEPSLSITQITPGPHNSLYVVSDTGLYVSKNNGRSWQRLTSHLTVLLTMWKDPDENDLKVGPVSKTIHDKVAAAQITLSKNARLETNPAGGFEINDAPHYLTLNQEGPFLVVKKRVNQILGLGFDGQGAPLLASPPSTYQNEQWPYYWLQQKQIDLAKTYKNIQSGGWVVLHQDLADPNSKDYRLGLYKAETVTSTYRQGFGKAATVTRLTTDHEDGLAFFNLRTAEALIGSRPLQLYRYLIPSCAPLGSHLIELNEGLSASSEARPIIVSGKRKRATFIGLGGLSQLEPGGWRALGLANTTVTAYAADTAATNRGVYRRHGDSWRLIGFKDQLVPTLVAADDGTLYAGAREDGNGGVSRFNGASWDPVGPASAVTQHLNCLGDVPYVANSEGVFQAAESGWVSVGQGLPTSAVVTLLGVGDRLFVGTMGSGVYVREGSQWQARNTGLPGSGITVLARGAGGRIYAGTVGRGVFVSADLGRSWSRLGTGLENQTVSCILEQNGRQYVGTNGAGVFVFAADLSQWLAIPSGAANQITSLADSGGQLLAGANAACRLHGHDGTQSKSFQLIYQASLTPSTLIDQPGFLDTLGQTLKQHQIKMPENLNIAPVFALKDTWLLSAAGVNEMLITVENQALQVFKISASPIVTAVGTQRLDLTGYGLPYQWNLTQWTLQDATGFVGTLYGSSDQIILASALKDDQAVGEIATATAVISVGQSRSVLQLAGQLRNVFDPPTVSLYGNVTPATQGAVQVQVLGNGNSAKPNQSFTLNALPLPAPFKGSDKGAPTTLEVMTRGEKSTKGTLWKMVPTFNDQGPTDRVFTLTLNGFGNAVVTFGDGRRGARLPNGSDNVIARYRTGNGTYGNLGPNTINVLQSHVPGLKTVTNPLPVSGGIGPTKITPQTGKKPKSGPPTQRLVSLGDFKKFALGYPGVAKANAAHLQTAKGPLLYLTLAGEDGKGIPTNTVAFQNFLKELKKRKAPSAPPVEVGNYVPLYIHIKARVTAMPENEIGMVKQQAVKALLAAFDFAKAQFGESVSKNKVVATLQAIASIRSAEVSALFPKGVKSENRSMINALPSRWNHGTGSVTPAELAYLPGADYLLITVEA